jgi:hypothetical protein
MAASDLQDGSVNIQWFGVPCHCRCRHCLIYSGARVSAVSYDRAVGIVERFVHWRKHLGDEAPGIHFAVSYCCDFPELPRYLKFCREFDSPVTYMPINGIGLRSGPQLEEFLVTLADGGVKQVNLTFYGTREFHDGFAGREGDLEFLLGVARLLPACGLERTESIYLVKDSLAELPQLVKEINGIAGMASRAIYTFDYRGRAKYLEDQRPTVDAVERLPEEVTRFVNRQSQRSEAEWLRLIAAGEVPGKSVRHFLISIWPENLQVLESEDCGRIISRLGEADEAFHRALPPLSEMAEQYGDPDGRRIYTLRDLEWKWQDAFLSDHPQLGSLRPFSDLESGVLRK